MDRYELFVRKMVGECRAAGIPGEKPHVTLQRFIERETGEIAPIGADVQEVWYNFETGCSALRIAA